MIFRSVTTDITTTSIYARHIKFFCIYHSVHIGVSYYNSADKIRFYPLLLPLFEFPLDQQQISHLVKYFDFVFCIFS